MSTTSMYFQDNRPFDQRPVNPAPNGWNDFTGAPPPGWTPQQPPQHRQKNSRVWIWAVVGLVGTLVMCFGALALLGTGGQPQGQAVIVEPSAETFTSMGAAPRTGQGNSTAQPSKAPAKKATAGIGDKVRIEGLEYQVHSVKCGIKHVGLEDFGHSAQGSFCRVDLSVTNQGKKARFWDADTNVEAEDTAGREFQSDGTAGIYGNKNGAGWLDEINPGNKVRAFVFFDLPKGAKLTKLEFTAGLFGDEVEVKV